LLATSNSDRHPRVPRARGQGALARNLSHSAGDQPTIIYGRRTGAEQESDAGSDGRLGGRGVKPAKAEQEGDAFAIETIDLYQQDDPAGTLPLTVSLIVKAYERIGRM